MLASQGAGEYSFDRLDRLPRVGPNFQKQGILERSSAVHHEVGDNRMAGHGSYPLTQTLITPGIAEPHAALRNSEKLNNTEKFRESVQKQIAT